MSRSLGCPSCRGALRQARGRMDYFCPTCRTAVSVLDETWAQVMSADDMERRLVPISECLAGEETLSA